MKKILSMLLCFSVICATIKAFAFQEINIAVGTNNTQVIAPWFDGDEETGFTITDMTYVVDLGRDYTISRIEYVGDSLQDNYYASKTEYNNYLAGVGGVSYGSPVGQKVRYIWVGISGGSATIYEMKVFSSDYSTSDFQSEIHVSPSGHKSGSGTIDDPINDIQTALNKIPNMKAVFGTAHIYIHGGEYYLEKPLKITPKMSGTDSNPVIIESYNDERVVLTGGRKIIGWKDEGNGIVSASASDFEYMGNLSVNGKGAVVSSMEGQNIIVRDYKRYSVFPVGVVANKSEIPSGATFKDAFITYYYAWQKFRLRTTGCYEDPDNSARLVINVKPNPSMYALYSHTLYGNPSYYMTVGTKFTLENDKSLVNNEGEFYFDSFEKKVYYKLRAGESADTISAYAGKEEELVRIDGECVDKKVKNIVFDGFVFSDVAWKLPQEEGFSMNQSVNISMPTAQTDTDNRYYAFVMPSAVSINLADNITVKNCDFYNIDKTALGMYDGVTNSRVEGNTFSYISGTAVSMGLPSHNEEDIGEYNAAYKKHAWTTNSYIGGYPCSITDDDPLSVWESNGATPTTDIYIDLERPCQISAIEMKDKQNPSYDSTLSRKNFRVDGSNSLDFSEYETLCAQGDTPYAAMTKYRAEVSAAKPYRYIRIVKTDGGQFSLMEARIMTKDASFKQREICKNNAIRNNYIYNIGTSYEGSVGVHIFKVQGVSVDHNFFNHIPYSAINLGWGWAAQENSTLCRNNYIGFNRIMNIMERRDDGGAIYTLGNLDGTVIEYNYINGSGGQPGGIYPDEGSSDLTVRYNTIANVPEWLQLWTGSIQNVTASGNYYLNAALDNRGGYGCSVKGNARYYESGNPSDVQADVDNRIAASGLTEEYYNIIYKVR